MFVRRGILLLWLTLAAPTCCALADELPVAQADSVDSPVASPTRGGPAGGRKQADAARGGFRDPAVRPVQYMGPQTTFDEPLGFSAARFEPGTPVDPSLNPGVLIDDPIEEYYDPHDPDAPAQTASSGDWLHQGYWYTQQSAVYMNRSVGVAGHAGYTAGLLATDFTSASTARNLSHLQIPPTFTFEPGLRSTFGRYLGRDDLNRDHAVEFTFLGLTHWQANGSLTAHTPGGIFSNLDPTLTVPAYNASDSQSYAISSGLNSYELNYRVSRRMARDRMIYTKDSTWVRQATPSAMPAIFVGVRVVTIAETLKYLAFASTADGHYNIATHNNLVGMQLGGEWFYERYEWRVGGRMKGAAMVNWASSSNQVRILDSAGLPVLPNRDENPSNHDMAFVAEMNFIGAYQFRPNFAFRASYDIMWVTDLALAPNQITFSPSTPPGLSTSHLLFFQGVSIGFEFAR